MRQDTEVELADIAKPFDAHAIGALRRGDIKHVEMLLEAMPQGSAGLDALSCHKRAAREKVDPALFRQIGLTPPTPGEKSA
jgi:hypothetical protein